MKTSGWIMLIISWGTIILALSFCFYETFKSSSTASDERDNNEDNK